MVSRVVVGLNELLELSVTFTLLDMEGERQPVERVESKGLVVDFHVVIDGLLVTKMEIVLLVVGRDHVVARVILLLLFFFIVAMLSFTGI